jgi:hypothetical protein
LPLLLRRLADHLREKDISSDEILHVVEGDEIAEYGSWWDITVYYDDFERNGSDADE